LFAILDVAKSIGDTMPSLLLSLTLAIHCVSQPAHVLATGERVDLRIYYDSLHRLHHVTARSNLERRYFTGLLGANGLPNGAANPALDLYGAPPRSDFRLLGDGVIKNGRQHAIYQRARDPEVDKPEIAETPVICTGRGW
jgi:hypothetical protein